jgi:hypothetical protein
MDTELFVRHEFNFTNVTDIEIDDILITGIQSFFYILLILTALVGNSLVILSVIKHKNLQIQENCYVVSLAIADLFIVIVMAFNACNQLFGQWLFGPFMCNLFNSLDVYFSTVSIFHLCCISVDRYFAVKKPLKYPLIITKKVISFTLITIWILPVSISFIPIFMGWHTYIFELNNKEECEFKVNKTYSVISSTISFWIPCIIMFYTYYQIFLEANKKEKQVISQNRVIAMIRRGNIENSNETCPVEIPCNTDNPVTNVDEENINIRREYRAAKTLGITLGIFIICWTPFFIWYISTAFCGESCASTNKLIIVILFWIGYANSIFNPIIYAYFNTNFKKAYLDTMKWVFLQK